MESLAQDIRFAMRTLTKRPGYALVIILTLALGIGANSAIFSVVSGVLLQPLPYPQGDELVVLQQNRPQAGVSAQPFTIHEAYDYRNLNRTFESVVEHHTMFFNLIGNGEPERVQTGVVSAEFFDTLGITPFLGRNFRPEDAELDAEAVLVLTYEYWQQSHGADPDIVGKTFEMNTRAHTVVGVLPPFPQYPTTVQVYMPTNACPFRANAERSNQRGAFRALTVFGRIADGESVESANADLARIAGSLSGEHTEFYPESGGYTANVAGLRGQLTDAARPTLFILLGTAGFVLLIVCANVANLTLARMLRREREMALRTALGAGTGRLVRQQITESTLLALVGGGLGLLLARAGIGVLTDFAARYTPRANEIGLDWTVLVFTLVVSLGTGVLFGTLPAMQRRRDLTAALRDGDRAGSAGAASGLRRTLVVAQLAVSFVLLIGAGLMIRSLSNLNRVDPGFEPERVLTMQIALDWTRFTTPQEGRAFWTGLLDALNQHPQIRSAAQGTEFPLGSGGLPSQAMFIESAPQPDPAQNPVITTRFVSDRYFDTLGQRILTGRGFDTRDQTDSAPVAVINEAMRRQFYAERDALGDRLSGDGQTWLTIVGVVSDARQQLNEEPEPEIYIPLSQGGFGSRLLVATVGEPAAMIQTIREEVYRIEPNQPVSFVQTMDSVRSDAMASPRLMTSLLSLFAGLALVITLAGISGLVAFAVNQRTQELGIRMALGAQRGGVLTMVVRQGMVLVFVGLGIGLVASIALGRLIAGFLFNVQPTDVATYLAVGGVFLAVAALACFLPARRATGIDPMIALRGDG